MRSIPLLMYHSIDERVTEDYSRWAVSSRRFGEQLSVLADEGYEVLTISQLVERLQSGTQLPDKCTALTFDDGLQDFATGAMPVLETFGLSATLYVVAGLVGCTSRWLSPLGEGSRPMLDAAELRNLVAKGIEIGAHSMTHPQLDLLAPEQARAEIVGSRNVLEDILGARVRSFAYPHGYASRTTRNIVRDAGFSSALRVRHALSSDSEDRFGLSRLIITEDVGPTELKTLLRGENLPIAPPQDRLLSQGWRFVRRNVLREQRHFNLQPEFGTAKMEQAS
ncbi:polysaccharide deacetylase family protein [Roseibium sp.]|uniref:polysaccharide deacetylase family protein n=1 Tax=Roseibium sp. TaxID=1936156 RepID=UPI0039EFAA7E